MARAGDLPFGPDSFRRIVGSFPTGVTVVTAAHGATRAGMTVSAFSSVSLDPPMVLVCLTESVKTARIIHDTRRFAVNFLAADQSDLSEQFAYLPDDERFYGVPLLDHPSGLPILEDTVGYLVCRLGRIEEGGDHLVFLGVAEDGAGFDREPLVYLRGDYAG